MGGFLKWVADTVARFNIEKVWDWFFGEQGVLKTHWQSVVWVVSVMGAAIFDNWSWTWLLFAGFGALIAYQVFMLFIERRRREILPAVPVAAKLADEAQQGRAPDKAAKGIDGLSNNEWALLERHCRRNLESFNHHSKAAKTGAQEADKQFKLTMNSLSDPKSEVFTKDRANFVVQSIARAEEAYRLSGFEPLRIAQHARLHPGRLPINDIEKVPGVLATEYRMFHEAIASFEEHEEEMRSKLQSDINTVSLELDVMGMEAIKRLRNLS